MTSVRLIVPCLALTLAAGTAQAGFGTLDLGGLDQRPLIRVATGAAGPGGAFAAPPAPGVVDGRLVRRMLLD